MRAEPLFSRLEEYAPSTSSITGESRGLSARRCEALLRPRESPLLGAFAGLLLCAQLQVRLDVLRPLRGPCGRPCDGCVCELPGRRPGPERRGPACHGRPHEAMRTPSWHTPSRSTAGSASSPRQDGSPGRRRPRHVERQIAQASHRAHAGSTTSPNPTGRSTYRCGSAGEWATTAFWCTATIIIRSRFGRRSSLIRCD